MPRSQFPLSRYIPKDSAAVNHPDNLGVVYTYQNTTAAGVTRLAAIAYAGNSSRNAWHFAFRTEEKRQEEINRFFAGLTSHKKRVAERREERSAPHNFQPGDIISNSWGYEQTNVDFYQITRVSASFVWLRPISGSIEETANMSGHTTPAPDHFTGPEEKHKATGDHINFKYGGGSKWTGKPVHCSWYA